MSNTYLDTVDGQVDFDQPYAGELPEDVVSIVESEFEDTDFYVDMLTWHEQSMNDQL